jgi:ribonuclease-3
LQFRDTLLLNRSLTHRSYLNEHPEALQDNERLEFLGDAILDFLVGAWLYHRFPEFAEGKLTRLRSALVRTEQLAAFGKEIGLDKALRLGRGEEESGGRQRPALLCAAFEAFVGALYLDLGLEIVIKFINPLLESNVGQVFLNGDFQDPKSKLQEWVQSVGNSAPVYNLVSAQGPDHAKTFEIEVLIDGKSLGRGSGHSKQAAAKAAARVAIQELGIK